MKKIISLVIIAITMLVMVGCNVNESSGSITVQNYTTEAAKNVKIGKVYIGYIAPGGTRTVYFFSEELDAQMNADGFEFQGDEKGTIDLKKNYVYSFNLYQFTNAKVFSGSGYLLGFDEQRWEKGIDYINMK